MLVLTQVPPQAVWPVEQTVEHFPLAHVWPDWQMLPHIPQFRLSDCVFVQTDPHVVLGAGHDDPASPTGTGFPQVQAAAEIPSATSA